MLMFGLNKNGEKQTTTNIRKREREREKKYTHIQKKLQPVELLYSFYSYK